VDALWSRLEAASEAHKQQVQQLQEKQQDLVMQLEQRDADCSQVSEHLLQVAQEQQQQAYKAISCCCEGEKCWFGEQQDLVVHVQDMPRLLASGAAQQGQSFCTPAVGHRMLSLPLFRLMRHAYRTCVPHSAVCKLQSCGVMATPIRIVNKQEEIESLCLVISMKSALCGSRPESSSALHTVQSAVLSGQRSIGHINAGPLK